MTKSDTWRRKYRWQLTWPEGGEDWSAYDGEICIGRVRLDKTTHNHKGMYMWNGNGSGHRGIKQTLMPHHGWKEIDWQAAKAVEDWWDASLAYNGITG